MFPVCMQYTALNLLAVPKSVTSSHQKKKMSLVLSFVFFFFSCFFLLTSSHSSDYCDPQSLPDPVTLRSDQLTVLISGYSEYRIPLLSAIALDYASHPIVASVLILWFNPSTPSSLLTQLLSLSPSISLHLHPSSSSLAARFLPRADIRTRSVLVCDDDIQISPRSLSFAFQISRSHNHRRLVGVFARSHDLDLASRSWIYTVHPDRYSIVLTKFLIVKTEYLHRFSCWGRLREAREVVERERNCEDILMNFVAAMEGGEGPVLVEGRGVRDWGDPRNDDDINNSSKISSRISESDQGALSARGDHRKKRGECIREFHRLLGEMPLRYSYGMVVEGVGEQGLCKKGGKLVYCDKQ